MITFSFTIARPSVTVKADGVLPSGIPFLTGQSGSGKSTFIKCIAGLVNPLQVVFAVMKQRGSIEIIRFGFPLKNVR